ncbi:hypothetical protein [Mesorhizobium sp. B4-1-3]|uniref:hypothetical protein n=1 Tax=Mesorhizobium sp. B4-1-3 TaxID=2589889 RepID=UPI0015E2C220|nr:hypothetical protein [Mesorhizobium sp. B4-1-3]
MGRLGGREPEAGARAAKAMLEEEGFAVRVENTTAVFADPAIAELSLIVPPNLDRRPACLIDISIATRFGEVFHRIAKEEARPNQ